MASSLSLEKLGSRKPSQSPATILSIGKANPPFCISQADFPDFYFRVTKTEHMTQLKEKFKRICEKSMVSKRHLVFNEEIINQNPDMTSYHGPSLNIRQKILVEEVPKLAMEAASKAIEEWGQPKSKITHLIVAALAGMDMPGADHRLTKLLGLPSSVKRVMLYLQGCYVGATLLRMAKDIAENNAGARVLVVTINDLLCIFRAPNEHDTPTLIGNAMIGDGAAAMIIGADPDDLVEKSLFQIVHAAETIIPGSDGAIEGHVGEAGFSIHLGKDVPKLIGNNIEKSLAEALGPTVPKEWDSFFWVVQPGGNAILDQIEARLGLGKEKLSATRHVLREFGNMGAVTVFFILDEVRRNSNICEEWGILVGLGAGITVDTIVLRRFPSPQMQHHVPHSITH